MDSDDEEHHCDRISVRRTAAACRMTASAQIIANILIWLVLFGGMCAFGFRLLPGRRRRRWAAREQRARAADHVLALEWSSAVAVRASNPRAHLAHVTNVYGSYPNRGVKAWITWDETGEGQDTWFEEAWPSQGAVVLIEGGTAWGPHNANPRVFYVSRILASARPGAYPAWLRCQERLR
jgi:hypothetical protein